MRINSINPTNFGTGIRIISVENKGRTYLYNEVGDLMREFHIPAVFKTEEIELPSVSGNFISRLKDLGIKFISMKK